MNADEASTGLDPVDPVAHTAGAAAEVHERRGQELEAAGRLTEAGQSFDRALGLDADRKESAEGRARIALALVADDAVVHCRRALAFHGSDAALQLQMIDAAASMIGTGALPLFEDYLSANPTNMHALEQLADLRVQGGREDPLLIFEQAIAGGRAREELYFAYARSLRRGKEYAAAFEVLDRARRQFGDSSALTIFEAQLALDSGNLTRAESCLRKHGDSADAARIRAQLLLHAGRTSAAATHLERLVAHNPSDASLWAMLSIAWRITANSRHEWLCQPALWRSLQLPLTGDELQEITAAVRRIHSAKAAPLGQSVRGGTQTPGSLFARMEPEVVRLRDAAAECVRDYVSNLPLADSAHPLLRHRDGRLAFGPSWSVRLTGGGFHVPHVHPAGVISSACYLSVPAPTLGSPNKAGWLELGRPPPEMAVDLQPLALLPPEPGTLVLFPSYLFHGTRPFAAGERLTAAFDVVAG
jgi:tetratricopeptide (TPR) repeat protein